MMSTQVQDHELVFESPTSDPDKLDQLERSTNSPYFARKSTVRWEENYWPTEVHVSESFSSDPASPGPDHDWAKPRTEVSTTLAASRRAEFEKTSWICNTWNTKLYSDVKVYCGLDRRVIKTSRLFLCGLSQYLRNVFLDHQSFYNEDTALILPDVDSSTLSDFLRNVSSGQNILAKIDQSLNFLDFGNIPDLNAELTSSSGPPEIRVHGLADKRPRKDAQMQLKKVGSKESYGEEQPTGAQDQTRRKKRKSSMVWKFFRPLNDNRCVCLLCKDVMTFNRGTTTRLLHHLRRYHGNDYARVLASKVKNFKTEPTSFRVKTEPTKWADHQEPQMETSMDTDETTESSSLSLLQDSSDSSGLSFQGSQSRSEDDKSMIFKSEPLAIRLKAKSSKKRGSFAWNYFQPCISSPGTISRAQCCLCKELVSFSGGTTSGMLRHLQMFHEDICPEGLAPGVRKQISKHARKKLVEDGLQQDHQRARQESLTSSGTLDDMRPEVFSSSPIWMIFKPDEDNPSNTKCSLCSTPFPSSVRSTIPLIHHIKENHTSTFNNIKIQLEEPDLPETYDPVNPLWQFFAFTDEISAQCMKCPNVFDIQEDGANTLTNHLSVDHPEQHADYKHHCNQWRLQRKEEYCTYKNSLKAGSVTDVKSK